MHASKRTSLKGQLTMVSGSSTKRCALGGAVLLATIAGLSACGSSDSNASSGANSNDKGTLTIGVDDTAPPFGLTQGNEIVGFDADVAHLIGEGLHRKVKIVSLPFANSVPAVQSGRVQISLIGGFTDNAERRGQMNLVDYLVSNVGVLTLAGNPKGISDPETMCGHTGATYSSTVVFNKVLTSANKTCVAAGKPGVKIVTYSSLSAGALAIRSGKADFFVDAQSTIGYAALKSSDQLSITKLPDSGLTESYLGAMGINKKDSTLATQVAKTLNEALAQGKFTAIEKKWGLTSDDVPQEITFSHGDQ